MPKTSLQQIDKQLKLIIKPELLNAGFTDDGRRTFRRTISHEGTNSVQIINFQVGIKSRTGYFTANLAVYNAELRNDPSIESGEPPQCFHCLPDLVTRLGFFKEPKNSLFSRIFQQSETSRDYWWRQSENETRMKKTVEEVKAILFYKGIPWLESMTNSEKFHWALKEREKRRKKSLDTNMEDLPPSNRHNKNLESAA